MMRFALCFFVALMTACADRVSIPTAPTPQADSTPSPILPRDPRDTVSVGSINISVLVTQGGQPISDGSVNAWIQQSGFGYSYWWAHGRPPSDAPGRYRFTGLSGGSTVYVEVFKPGLIQQCASVLVLNGDKTDLSVETKMIRDADVSASSAPTPEAPGFRSISGTVVDTVNGVKRPLAGVEVWYEPAMDVQAARTYSAADGHFLLCGIPDDAPAPLAAWIGGQGVYVTVPARAQNPIEIAAH